MIPAQTGRGQPRQRPAWAQLWRLRQCTQPPAQLRHFQRRCCTPQHAMLCACRPGPRRDLRQSETAFLSSMAACAQRRCLCLSGCSMHQSAGASHWSPAPAPQQRLIRQAAVRRRLRSGQEAVLCCNGQPASRCLAAGHHRSHRSVPGVFRAIRAQTALPAQALAWHCCGGLSS